LKTYNGIDGSPLYPPSPFTGRIQPGPYGDCVLFVGRLEAVKRPELAIRAMCNVDRPIRLVVVGDGTCRAAAEALADSLGVADRVPFLGAVAEARLVELYGDALAVIYTPYDEDYGYVTLEAFLARKPVVTASDSGGPLEFVDDNVNGLVVAPDAE